MVTPRQSSKKRSNTLTVLTVFILVLIVFVIGILLGNSISTSDVNDLQTLLQESELNTESYLIEQELIGVTSEQSCNLAEIRAEELSAQLYELGQKLNSENPKKELGQRKYNLLKRKFHLMQIKNYLLFYSLKQNCNLTSHIILYYYEQDDPKSLEQGSILDRLVSNYDINVFAVEYNYSSDLNFLETYYNVKKGPSIVIDYNTVMDGVVSYPQLEQMLTQDQ